MIKVFYPTFINSPCFTILESFGTMQFMLTGTLDLTKGMQLLLRFSLEAYLWFLTSDACMMSVKLSLPLTFILLT